KDPELRYTPSGTAVVTFSLATTERYKDRDGNKQTKTEWHNIVAWRQLAEICGKFLHKGKQIYIEGKIQNRSYDDRDGNKRYISEVVVNEMQMLGSRDDNQQSGGSYGGGQSQNQGDQNQGNQSYNQGGQNGGQAQRPAQNNQQNNQGQNSGFAEPVFNPDDEIPF
ncbi:MAG: single-stranded DNA-binding protein, partial [Desulfuromonadales bacterium]|nr:single-stranded DNA-binding protein [Desulfuromonadales bacterium]